MKHVFRKIAVVLIAAVLMLQPFSGLKVSAGGGTQSPGVYSHTPEEITAYIEANPSVGIYDEAQIYQSTPSTTDPYDPGSLKFGALVDGLNAVKQVRYAAGLDPDITLSSFFSLACQAGALVNAANSALSHTPARPAGMEDELYSLGCEGCGSSNIAHGLMALKEAVMDGWMYDGDYGNISALGHRRWILNPPMASTGFGQVGAYTQMYAFDESNTDAAQERVVWPAQEMPYCWMKNDLPWSVSFGETVNANNIGVSIYRMRDSKEWHFSASNQEDGYFAVNNEYYGQKGCVIFRPDNLECLPGDTYDVYVNGGPNGTLYYTVHLFTLVNSSEKSGKAGNLTWKLTTDNRLVISGKGAVPDYSGPNDAPWQQYKDYISTIEIGEGVTGIGQYAFSYIPATKVLLPSSLKSISSFAFYYNKSLQEIHLPKGLQRLQEYAFYSCTSLKYVYIPTTVTSMEFSFIMCAVTDVMFPGTQAQFDAIPGKSYLTSQGASVHCGWTPNIPYILGFAVIPEETAIGAFFMETPYASKYKVQRLPKGGSWETVVTTTNTGFTDKKATIGTYYTYKVTAYDITAGWKSSDNNSMKLWFNPFYDVSESDSYFEKVMWAARNGITGGTSKTTFSPNKDCSRYQFAVMLYKYAGKPAVSGTLPFTDVAKNATYYDAVLWANKNGIISGTSKTTFSPNDPVKRYQVVQMLYKYAGKPAVQTAVNPFKDVKKENSYYNAVLWAVENGITKGTSATTFSPEAKCVRSQMVTFLYKYSRNIDHRND